MRNSRCISNEHRMLLTHEITNCLQIEFSWLVKIIRSKVHGDRGPEILRWFVQPVHLFIVGLDVLILLVDPMLFAVFENSIIIHITTILAW